MRWNRLLSIGCALGALLLLTASAYAQAVVTDKPADRSFAAAVRYVEGALASNTARGLQAARSFGEKLANKTTAGTEQAWAAATGVVRRAMDKLGHVVDVAWRPL